MEIGMEKSELRKRIVAAAVRLFHERGYAATPVAALLKEAGINSGSLYFFFPNKEAVLLEVLRWHNAQLVPLILKPIEMRHASGQQRVLALLEWIHQNLMGSDCQLGSALGLLAAELSEDQVQARELITTYFQAWRARLRSWFMDIPQTTGSPDTWADHLLALIEGGIILARAEGKTDPFDKAAQSFKSLLAIDST